MQILFPLADALANGDICPESEPDLTHSVPFVMFCPTPQILGSPAHLSPTGQAGLEGKVQP